MLVLSAGSSCHTFEDLVINAPIAGYTI